MPDTSLKYGCHGFTSDDFTSDQQYEKSWIQHINISLISDNNLINRNSFKLLSGTNVLNPSIINPVNRDNKIYIIFDTVHLLKCVRNNLKISGTIRKHLIIQI